MERVTRQSGLAIDLEVDLDRGRGRPGPDVESAGYRLVQEGLTNVVKHAGARRVALRVADAGGAVEMTLSDDGNGFDPEAATHGFGLVGMRERIALVHGTLDVRSAPGGGTTIRARIPSGRPGATA